MAKTKKVLFTSHTANFSKFNRPFMRMLAEQGYEVHYASAGEEPVKDCDKHFTVPFERSPFKLNNLRALAKLKKIIDAQDYDIIHTHTPMGSVVTRLAAISARKKGTRVIYTAHGFHFFKGAPLLNWLIYYPIEKFMARHTDTLITINREDYERASKKFKTDAQYVPGVGVDLAKFDIKMSASDRNKIRKSLGLKPNDFVMIYVAEINKNKNQLWLIKIIAKLINSDRKIHLLLVGQDNLNGKCQAQAKKLNIQNNIHFLGYRKDIPQLMKISDLAVSASKREGLPVNIIEAMAAGLPIVCTAIRGCHELIKTNKNGYLYEIQDGKSFINSIKLLKNSQSLLQNFSQKGVTISKHYSLENIQNRMNTLYDIITADTIVNQPIRVLQIVTAMNRGGLETMLMNYYRHIDRNKVQFDFLVHRLEKGAYDDEILNLGGKIYHYMPIDFKNLPKYRRGLKAFFAKHPEYTIVHSHMDALSALPLSAAKAANIPKRIAHSHSDSFDKDGKYFIRIVLKHFINRYATEFFGCSEAAIKSMFGTNIKNYKLIENAINVDAFNYNPEQRKKIRTTLCLQDEFVIGHVGRFDYPKNHEFLIDIFNEMQNIDNTTKLILVGDGEKKALIEEKIRTLGLTDNVKFLGTRSDVANIMQGLDAFVMPSKYEGLPVVSIEAQASGLPCFFSTAITKDVAITQNCDFIDLSRPPCEWAKIILGSVKKRREDTKREMSTSGYDIQNKAKEMRMTYESLLKK